jgi:hypothetical protein
VLPQKAEVPHRQQNDGKDNGKECYFWFENNNTARYCFMGSMQQYGRIFFVGLKVTMEQNIFCSQCNNTANSKPLHQLMHNFF